ncbi:hypothetical protein OBBRIDRAFT_808479 [Obba rivulosa]|uniref:Uncharacterized protein n=1 Tax=Obba rivulosa TaxID=1052685 RepID=A0A8E2AP00_9APHY|nr:hypothetical protein OBBRIDRAFT_808479 [Obba rivulosa]
MPTMKAKTGTSHSVRMATARCFDHPLPPGSTACSLTQVFNQEQIVHHREESRKSMLDAISVPEAVQDNCNDNADINLKTLSNDQEGSFVHALRDLLTNQWKYRWYKDRQTWHQHIECADLNWAPLLEHLADVYLEWRYHGEVAPPSAPPATEYDFTLDIVNIYTLDTTPHIHRNVDSCSAVEAIAQHGYLATTSINPSLVISFKTLELFHPLRLRKPSFSIEAYVKVICDFYAFSG